MFFGCLIISTDLPSLVIFIEVYNSFIIYFHVDSSYASLFCRSGEVYRWHALFIVFLCWMCHKTRKWVQLWVWWNKHFIGNTSSTFVYTILLFLEYFSYKRKADIQHYAFPLLITFVPIIRVEVILVLLNVGSRYVCL